MPLRFRTEKKLQGIKGLGAKMEEKLHAAIARMGTTGKEKRTPIARALPVARELVAELEAHPDVERARGLRQEAR